MKTLAIPDEDMNKMAELKINWNSIEKHPTIVCADRNCNYSTKLFTECLVSHCVDVHKYSKHLCPKNNCEFEAYSKE